MLQLPSSTPRRQFSKAEIADITRGTKARAKIPPADPVLKLLEKADAALIAYIKATNEKFVVEQTMDRNDIFGPRVYPTDDLLNVYWPQNYMFTSEGHIDREFRATASRLRASLKDCRARLRKAQKMKGHNWENVRIELSQAIEFKERKLAKLKPALPRIKSAFRKEAKRIAIIHRKTGLDKARDRARAATRILDRVTREMRNAKPRTVTGALGLISYVQKRIGCGKSRLFDDDEGYFPSNSSILLIRAETLLEKALRNG